MDPIELIYDSMDAVPEAFRALYVEKDGKAVLTHVNGMKSSADVAKVTTAKDREVAAHAETKRKLALWGDRDPTETLAKLDRVAELEQAAGGKLDDKAIDGIVEGRLQQKVGPLQRQLETVTAERDAAVGERDKLNTRILQGELRDHIRGEAKNAKLVDSAVLDAELLASTVMEKNSEGQWVVKDGVPGFTPGTSAREFFADLKKTRPHWWPAAQGAGAQGGKAGAGNGADNPFSHAGWNLTKQGEMVRGDRAAAEAAAKAAGTSIGGPRPAAPPAAKPL